MRFSLPVGRLPWVKSLIAAAVAAAVSVTPALAKENDDSQMRFNRIASFAVYLNTDVDNETVAEIIDTTKDGNTLIYTDAAGGNLGFVDIKNPRNPLAAGVIAMGGEPTSVAVAGDYALVVVNTSPSFVAPSGKLAVVDIKTQTIITTHDLGGQPDAVAVSPDGKYAAVIIENERDEDLGDGEPPQAPGGFLVIVDLTGEPADWTLRGVDLNAVPDLFPEDAEPEYVDISVLNIAAVTFQENNHIALVHLPSGEILRDFSAGSVDLTRIDTNENDLIELNGSLQAVPREPDGVAWIAPFAFATADEGDLFGGSRGFTIFGALGNIRYASGNSLEHLAARLGHYPEDRSENKGNEPENVDYGVYGKNRYLFVASERSSVIYVYELRGVGLRPSLVQVLPAGLGPEGVKAIPQRNLLVSASENDARADGVRSVITIYQLQKAAAEYPTVVSADRADGTPIPWAALSGLDSGANKTLYTIHDSFYQQARIFSLDASRKPAVITGEIVLKDTLGKLAAVDPVRVNSDGTVNLDLEGIAVRSGGGFWLASEGDDAPVRFLNFILQIAPNGDIEDVVTLPEAVNNRMTGSGYEGVAVTGSAAGNDETVYVAFQRRWTGDRANHVRIGRYEVASGEWTFFYYPLDAVESPNGGWVGLSELTHLGGDSFAVVERDNQANTDARVKRIYTFSVAGITPAPEQPGEPEFPVLSKTLARDILPDLQATGGMVLEKIEGMTVTRKGDVLIVNDNDGVDDSNGETQLLNLGKIFKK